eukprot:scaffold50683_cov52-Phaeocystis_antarctica.AAC.2
MSSLLASDKELAGCRVRRRAYDAGRGVGQETGGPRATAAHAACRGGRDCRLGAGHGEERTANMLPMLVTLEVLKLSGWLNIDAPCRESKEGHAERSEFRDSPISRSLVSNAERSEVYGSGGSRQWTTAAHAACRGGRGCRLGAGHGEERTPNMRNMDVTLDVSKLSGWLNADAYCRESKEGHAVRVVVYGSGGSRRRATAAHAACRRGHDCRLGAGHAGRSARGT